MAVLNDKELDIVEQLARQPLAEIPPNALATLEKLTQDGVVLQRDSRWHLTKVGQIIAGQALQ